MKTICRSRPRLCLSTCAACSNGGNLPPVTFPERTSGCNSTPPSRTSPPSPGKVGKVDLSHDAFLQVEVDEPCRKLLIINTYAPQPIFLQHPGVKVVPGAFQQFTDTLLAGLECTAGYLDAVIVGSRTLLLLFLLKFYL